MGVKKIIFVIVGCVCLACTYDLLSLLCEDN